MKDSVRINKAGCFSQCGHGPMVVVYPENVWYSGVKDSDLTDLFALVWEGNITAPESGSFLFRLDADDAARVVVDGRPVVEVRGIGPMDGSRLKQGKIDLSAG